MACSGVIMTAMLVALAIVSPAVAAPSNGTMTTGGGNWKMDWTIDPATSVFEASVWGKATGWVAMGLSLKQAGHSSCDMAIGYLPDGKTPAIADGFSTSRSPIPIDVTAGGKDNLVNLGGGLSQGGILFRFKRPFDTGDAANDVVISQQTPLFVAWAFGNDVPVASANGGLSFRQHGGGSFGVQQADLFAAAGAAPGAAAPAAPGGAAKATAAKAAKTRRDKARKDAAKAAKAADDDD